MSQSLYKYAIVLHLGFGFWMFSNGEIVQYKEDFASVSSLQGGIKKFSSLGITDRASTLHSMIMLIAFLFMAGVYIVGYILSRFFCCRSNDHAAQTADLLDHLGYEDAMNEYLEVKLELQQAGDKYPELAARLLTKMETLGGLLLRFLERAGCGQAKEFGAADLTREFLYKFFYANREKLARSRIDGLYTYRIMVR